MIDRAEEFIAWIRPRLCAPCHWLMEQNLDTVYGNADAKLDWLE